MLTVEFKVNGKSIDLVRILNIGVVGEYEGKHLYKYRVNDIYEVCHFKEDSYLILLAKAVQAILDGKDGQRKSTIKVEAGS